MKKAFYNRLHSLQVEKPSDKSLIFAKDTFALSGLSRNDLNQNLIQNVSVASKIMADYMLNTTPNIQKAIAAIIRCLSLILPPEKQFFSFPVIRTIDINTFLEKMQSHSEVTHSVLVNEWPAGILRIIESSLKVFWYYCYIY